MVSRSESLIQCGREITAEDIRHAREVVELFPCLSRVELAQTLCEHWGWVTASGAYKADACVKLLEKLEAAGVLKLPKKRTHGQKVRPVQLTARTAPPSDDITGELSELDDIGLKMVVSRNAKDLWNEYVNRYHYLGYKQPCGFRLRYFIESKQGCLGCVLLAGPAKALGKRDRWIGWSDVERLKNLPWIVNNTRFLIFPWVHVRNLASHILGRLARRIRKDWRQVWGYGPLLMETFVDPARYVGVSYRAAGWQLLGNTTGEGLVRQGRSYRTTPKQIFVRALVRDCRTLLCSDSLQGESEAY